MTISELIAILQTMPQDADVSIRHEYRTYDVDNVESWGQDNVVLNVGALNGC